MPWPIGLLACLLFLSAEAVIGGEPPTRFRPNVVYILADDLGYGDVKRLNPSSKIATPTLDQFAREGVTFTDAHSGSAVCTPTRCGLLTGRYAWRSSLTRGVLGGYSPPLIEPGRLTVPAFLASQGYATTCVGKWHLGMTWPTKDGAPIVGDGYASESRIDFDRPITDGPLTRGFGSFFGISASLDMPPYAYIDGDHLTARPTARQSKVGYVREGAKDPAFRFDRVLPDFVERAAGFIKDQAKAQPDRPLFLYLALGAPHTPVAPSREFLGKSGAGEYGDFVEEVDAAIGRILVALDEAKLKEKTLVMVTSDNGPETPAYPRITEHQHYSMGPLRGLKRDAWEGGHRVPFFARWPGRIPAGSVSDETICHVDLMATLAGILDVPLPNNAAEDSVNIAPALFGQPRQGPLREATVHHSAAGRFAIRQGPLVFIDAPSGDDNNREPAWLKTKRGYTPHNQPGELFDLAKDPSEKINLHATRPEDVKRLKFLLEKYKAGGRSVPARP